MDHSFITKALIPQIFEISVLFEFDKLLNEILVKGVHGFDAINVHLANVFGGGVEMHGLHGVYHL